MDYFFRNGEGDEVVFVHEGSGVLETIFGDVPYKEGDYVVIPRGTTYRFQPAPRLPEAASASGPGGEWRSCCSTTRAARPPCASSRSATPRSGARTSVAADRRELATP